VINGEFLTSEARQLILSPHDRRSLRVVPKATSVTRGVVMPKDSTEVKADSALWTSSASTVQSFEAVTPPKDLADLAERVAKELEATLKKRVKAYKTQITQETLSKPVR
jgi:hypothetical protein